MKRRHLYLLFCVIGIALPYSQFLPWLSVHGFDVALFCREVFANRVSGFFASDVLVSAVVLIVFIQVEGRRLRMSYMWPPIVGTLLVGVSLGLPLFLYFRQIHFDRQG